MSDATYKPTAIDLFSGCGGLTEGLRQAGFRVVAAVEIDPLAVETYKVNHPEVILDKPTDIRDVNPRELLESAGVESVDLIAGCPPCQGFSRLRTRNGSVRIDDPRNDLLFAFQKFVLELKPLAIMLENVPGLLKDPRFRIFQSKLKNELHYIGEPEIFNAADFEVPQRRRRLIYIAGKGFSIPYATPSTKRKTVRQAIEKLPPAGTSGDPLHDLPEFRTEKITNLIRLIPQNGGSRKDIPEEYQLACHKRCKGFNDIYGRMAWDKVSPTITSGCFNPSKGRFLHPEEDRAITIREAALLQEFRKSYYFPINKGKSLIASMIGNALPPTFIKSHAQNISEALIEELS